MPIELFRYEGATPSNEFIQKNLLGSASSKKFLYIVATGGQYRLREDLDRESGTNNVKCCFIFRDYIRYLLDQLLFGKYLSRPDERISLKRAMSIIANNDEERDRLHQDVFAWMNALAECAEREIDLRLPLLPPYSEQVVNQSVAELLERLNSQMRSQCFSDEVETIAIRSVEYLRSERFSPPPLVVLEGFTFLTPLQNFFIDACLRIGVTVRILIPFVTSQATAFAVMSRTYERYGGEATMQPFPTEEIPDLSNGVALLRGSLFSEANAQTDEIQGVELVEFGHQSDEVASCIGKIQELIIQGVTAEQIAIVTRDPGAFESRLQEEAQFQKLSVSLGIPPRHLLLTPLGQFALLLYQVYSDGAISINADQFEAMIASGWLGLRFQRTLESFQAVRHQFFVNCQSRTAWWSALQALESVRANLVQNEALDRSRMPAASATRDDIAAWQVALDRIEQLCMRIFAAGEQTVNEHVRYLLSELGTLDLNEVRVYERELLERIRVALLELENSNSLAVTPGEFGEILNSMVKEYENPVTDTEEAVPSKNMVWVTTPEGIDCCSKHYVFYLGLDSKRVPRSAPDPWPFYRNEVAYYQERERYLFLAVIRATRKHLVLSYAKIDEADTYTVSPYLYLASRILNIPISTPPEQFSPQDASIRVEPKQQSLIRRSTYDLSEVAIFGLCPFRYKLERLSRDARRYRSDFTTGHYACSTWFERIYILLTDQPTEYYDRASAEGAIDEAISATAETIRRDFPSLREATFYLSRSHIEKSFKYIIDKIQRQLGGDFRLRFVGLRSDPAYRTASYTVTTTNGTQVVVNVDGLQFAVAYGENFSKSEPLEHVVFRSEWLLPPSVSSTN